VQDLALLLTPEEQLLLHRLLGGDCGGAQPPLGAPAAATRIGVHQVQISQLRPNLSAKSASDLTARRVAGAETAPDTKPAAEAGDSRRQSSHLHQEVGGRRN
jgi:hypothetical protein